MKKLLFSACLLALVVAGRTQVVPPPPGNPNISPQNPNVSPANPNYGLSGSTGPSRGPDYPQGTPGATGITNIGMPGLSGELNDNRNRNLDYNKNIRGITGPTGGTYMRTDSIYPPRK